MESVTLTSKEQTRVAVLNEVTQGGLTATEAAGLLGVSVRQIRRILAAYRREGVAAIAHGNRGRVPSHTTTTAIRARGQRLVQLRYSQLAWANMMHQNGFHVVKLAVWRCHGRWGVEPDVWLVGSGGELAWM
jgi:predicted ArsR family transcriptional regulator